MAGEGVGASPVRAALRYGRDCIGCTAGLILVLFAVGVMSVFWMVVVVVLILWSGWPRWASASACR